jgi:hypothetical protein
MASCARCGGPFGVCDRTLYCRRCNQIAALHVFSGGCPACQLDYRYDTATGNLVPVHERGCSWLRDFKLKARIIADDDPGNTGQPPRTGR